MVKSYNEETIRLINSTILNDEFKDRKQNELLYESHISGRDELARLLDCRSIQGVLDIPVLNVGSGGTGINDLLSGRSVEVKNLEPNEERGVDAVQGWCENLPIDLYPIGLIVCWGTFCFVRSVPETLIEFNKVLCPGGQLVMDVIKYTTMPLAQTVDPECFTRYIRMFGFEMDERIFFGERHHQRCGFRFTKREEFNPRNMMMPQSEGKVYNFLKERDWYLL